MEVRLGGGLDYLLTSRVRVRSAVEINRFRLDRYSLAPGGTSSGRYPVDAEADDIRNNFSIGLSLDYAIGQSRFLSSQARERIYPFTALELEPMAGRLNFDDPEMPSVSVLGARIGGELNPWVGWGLHYWHAMESDLSDSRPLQSFGGEARLKLASKVGPQPYVIIGAGRLDFRSGYTDFQGVGRDDKTALILGAGVRAEIFRGLQLNVGVRDLMYSEGRLGNVSGTEEISHNWLLSGALVIGIGGRGGDSRRCPTKGQPLHAGTPETEIRKGAVSPAEREIDTESTREGKQIADGATRSGYVSDRSVVIPVPLEGEIYIRYGKTSSEREKSPIETKTIGDAGYPDISTAGDIMAGEARADSLRELPVTVRALDSLKSVLLLEIGKMMAARTAGKETLSTEFLPDTGKTEEDQDSVVSSLRRKLAESEQERQRLDSILRLPSLSTQQVGDSLANAQIQQKISDQVAALLSTRPTDSDKVVTQSELRNMMAMLMTKMDSASVRQAVIDSARLWDHLQLEVLRQTKSQEEFQQALEEFIRKYEKRQEDRVVTPPAIIVSPPAPSPQLIEVDKPPPALIMPDTQYVVVRDTSGRGETFQTTPGSKVDTTLDEKGFLDLRPTGYMGLGLDKPRQFLLGGRLDIGPITVKEERLRLVPEFALGSGGGGVSIMAVLNAEYAIADLEAGDYLIVPFVRVGFGVLGMSGEISDKKTEGVLNFIYGISVDSRQVGLLREIGNPAILVEHQIIDFFDFNRLVLGLQWLR